MSDINRVNFNEGRNSKSDITFTKEVESSYSKELKEYILKSFPNNINDLYLIKDGDDTYIELYVKNKIGLNGVAIVAGIVDELNEKYNVRYLYNIFTGKENEYRGN